jgi:mRNA interferase MazF
MADVILMRLVAWTKVKFKLRASKHNEQLYFKEREIWWASLGMNIGYEQDGKNKQFERPILVLRKFNKDMLWCLSLLSKVKDGPYYHSIHNKGVTYSVILLQVRTISSKRLRRKIRTVPTSDFLDIKERFKHLL